MRRLLLRLFIAVVVIPTSVVGILYSLNQQGFFNLQMIEIQIQSPESQSKFVNPLKISIENQLKQFTGQSLWDLKLSEISKILKSEKWIEKHHISRKWPDGLSIHIEAFEVQFLMLSKDRLVPVVKDGQSLPPVTAQTAPDVAILNGVTFEKNIEMRKKAIDLLQSVPRSGKFSAKTIAEVQYSPKEGFWATLIQSGVKVKMGEDRFDLKAKRVSQILDYLDHRQLEARVIDADLSKKVLVRLRKGP